MVRSGQFIVFQCEIKLSGFIIQTAQLNRVIGILDLFDQKAQRLRIEESILLGWVVL